MAAGGFSTSNYISNTVGGFDVGPWTMFCWFKRGGTSLTKQQSLMWCGVAGDGDPAVALHVSNATGCARLTARLGSVNAFSGTTFLDVDTWYPIAGSDNAAGTDRKLWVNGAVENSSVTAIDISGCTGLHLGVGFDIELGGNTLDNPILTGAEPLFRLPGGADEAVSDGAGAFAACTPTFPATVVDEDIAFLQIAAYDNGTGSPAVTINTPSGWTLIGTQNVTAGTGDFRQSIFSKECDGTEGGTSVTINGTTAGTGANALKGIYGRMYVFSDVVLASFTESGGVNSGTDTSAEIASITTTGNNRRGLFFCAVANDVTQAAITGNTAIYTEVAAESSSAVGPDVSIGCQSAQLATTGTYSGGNAALGAGPVAWLTRSFAIKPRNSGVQGMLAHCAVWNVELSADDHAELAAGLSPKLVRADALVSYSELFDSATLNEVTSGPNTLTGSLTFDSG